MNDRNLTCNKMITYKMHSVTVNYFFRVGLIISRYFSCCWFVKKIMKLRKKYPKTKHKTDKLNVKEMTNYHSISVLRE